MVIVSGDAIDKCRPVCDPKIPSQAICAADNHQKKCFRMSQCQLDEENCRRRAANLPSKFNGYTLLIRKIFNTDLLTL